MPWFVSFFLAGLKSRVTQLLARALAGLLLFLCGKEVAASPDAAHAVQQGAEYLWGAGGLFLVDLVIHSSAYGRLRDWWQCRKGVGGAAMLLVAFVILPAAVGLAGCAQEETNRAAQGMIFIQTAAANATDQVNAGGLTENEARTLQGAIHDGQTAVNAYYQAIRTHDSDALAKAKAAIAVARHHIEQLYLLYHLPMPTPIELPPLPATTRPGN